MKSLPNNPNDADNYDAFAGLGKELNYEIGLFRYFPDVASLEDESQKISSDRKVRLSTVWEPSIPGVLVKNRTSFENQKINIIKNYASLCDELNVPVKVL